MNHALTYLSMSTQIENLLIYDKPNFFKHQNHNICFFTSGEFRWIYKYKQEYSDHHNTYFHFDNSRFNNVHYYIHLMMPLLASSYMHI